MTATVVIVAGVLVGFVILFAAFAASNPRRRTANNADGSAGWTSSDNNCDSGADGGCDGGGGGGD